MQCSRVVESQFPQVEGEPAISGTLAEVDAVRAAHLLGPRRLSGYDQH